MSERSRVLESIAATVSDYRAGALPVPSPGQVDRWAGQFDTPAQLPILRELDHVLKKTYFSRARTQEYLAALFGSPTIVRGAPCTFWKGIQFLDIQRGGASQAAMLALFSEILAEKCGFTTDECGADPHTCLYLDDAIFSGGRMKQDLLPWIADKAPRQTSLCVVSLAAHRSAYYNKNQVQDALKASGKKIDIEWRHGLLFEDRQRYIDISDVLRPVSIPADPMVEAYAASLERPPRFREPGRSGQLGIFSSEAGRQVLEQEFLKAGVRIRQMSGHFNEFLRPLGNKMLESLGFGSLIVTYRNCPNNTPLALWAGAPWYPLFPRTTNRTTAYNRLAGAPATGPFR